jgi:hydrogenase/urease accessory protein HupE
MNLEQFAMAAFVLIGLVNGIQLALDRNWASFTKFLMAVIAGGVFGLLQWFGLPNVETGLAVGISSSGVYKIAKKIGGE